jgi:methanogenic corrinoid protein MtbC1
MAAGGGMATRNTPEPRKKGSPWVDCSGLQASPKDPEALPGADSKDLARLIKTVEVEIVPRLVMLRRSSSLPAAGYKSNELPDELDVKELVRLLLNHAAGVASAYVETVRRRGASLEGICLELLAPAARELGVMWEEDRCDFMQVTVGLCRLHQVLRELSPAFACREIDAHVARRILLSPIPGEQHTFGVTLVAHFLRRAGWDVWEVYPDSCANLMDLARSTYYSVIGLSLGCQTRIEEVRVLIAALRSVSRNPGVGILIGGPLLVARPELAKELGADSTAPDGPIAVEEAERIKGGAALPDGLFSS